MLLATTSTKRPTHRKKNQMCSSSEDNYSLPDSHKYTVVSSVCSPAFVIGSTKTLAVKYTNKKKGGHGKKSNVFDSRSPTGTPTGALAGALAGAPTGTPTGTATPTGTTTTTTQSNGFPKSGSFSSYSGRPKKRGPYKPRIKKKKEEETSESSGGGGGGGGGAGGGGGGGGAGGGAGGGPIVFASVAAAAAAVAAAPTSEEECQACRGKHRSHTCSKKSF